MVPWFVETGRYIVVRSGKLLSEYLQKSIRAKDGDLTEI